MSKPQTTRPFQKILLVQTAFIGDVILATALVEKLRFHYPTAQLDFLLRKGNESLFQNNPQVNKVLIWDKKKKYRSLWQLIGAVRQQQYDAVICLQRFGSMGLLTALSGARVRVGFDKNPFSWFFTNPIKHQQVGLHEVERNTQLVSWFTDEVVFKPKLYPPVIPAKLTIQKPYLCLAPTSVWFTKQFHESKWIELIQALSAQYHLYLLGAPTDWEACERIRQAVPEKATQVENVAGKLTLLESAALMQQAVLNFVNDSAPMHLASAVNAPTCAIFCSTVPEFGFGPLADFAKIVQVEEPLSCRPCGLHGKKACPEGHFRCSQDIQVQSLLHVLEQAQQLPNQEN
ncbi:MAG: glycosyltransferase family 9 protein [Spirosomataceae bacterium]